MLRLLYDFEPYDPEETPEWNEQRHWANVKLVAWFERTFMTPLVRDGRDSGDIRKR